MRLQSSIFPTPISSAPAAQLVEVNPFRSWLNLLAVGAIFSAIAFTVDGIWQFMIFTARAQGFPGHVILGRLYPYALFCEAACQWMAIWLLTTEDPQPRRQPRLRANLLRVLITCTFLTLCALLFDLVPRWQTPFVRAPLIGLFSVTLLILWVHLRWLTARLAIRSVQWRAAGAAIGCLIITVGLVSLPPVAEVFLGIRISLSREVSQVRQALAVLWASVSAVIMARAALGFWFARKRF